MFNGFFNKFSKKEEKENNIKVERNTFESINEKSTKAQSKYNKEYEEGNTKLSKSTEENFLHISELVFSCVDYISKGAGQAVPRLYQIDKQGNKIPVKDKTLKDWVKQPNPFQSWGQIIEMSVQGLLLSGVAPITFEKLKGGKYESWFLTNPSNVSVVPDKKDYIKGFIYKVGNNEVAYKNNEIFWIINPTLNNAFYGLPAVKPLVDTLRLEGSAIEELSNFYEGSNIVGGILKAEYPLNPEQIAELREQFNSLFGAKGSNRRGTAILPAKMDYKQIQATPKDAMLLDSLDVSEKRVFRVFKINPAVLGGEYNSGASKEIMKLVFNTAIRPFLYRIADQISLSLSKEFNKEYLFEFDFDRIPELDTPLSEKADASRTLLATGVITLNEARDLLGLSKLEFEGADKNLIPAFLAGKDASFFQDIGEIETNNDNLENIPQDDLGLSDVTGTGSTDPLGGEPDLTMGENISSE